MDRFGKNIIDSLNEKKILTYRQNRKKVVELPLEEFELLISRVRSLEKDIENCKEINKYLNKQIEDYNNEFSKKQVRY